MYLLSIIIATESSYRRILEIRLCRAHIFPCLSLLTSSASFKCLVSIIIICYLGISDYLHVGIEIIWKIICVGTVEEANEGLDFLGVCPCLPSSYYFVCALYLHLLALWGEPYWYITIHPSE